MHCNLRFGFLRFCRCKNGLTHLDWTPDTRDTKCVLKWVLVRIAAFCCARRPQIWIPEAEYYQKVSSHAQIRPQGAEKQLRKVRVGVCPKTRTAPAQKQIRSAELVNIIDPQVLYFQLAVQDICRARMFQDFEVVSSVCVSVMESDEVAPNSTYTLQE